MSGPTLKNDLTLAPIATRLSLVQTIWLSKFFAVVFIFRDDRQVSATNLFIDIAGLMRLSRMVLIPSHLSVMTFWRMKKKSSARWKKTHPTLTLTIFFIPASLACRP